jgi:2-dehydro-3-deoxygluconokinase
VITPQDRAESASRGVRAPAGTPKSLTLDVLTCGEAMGVVESDRVGPMRLGGSMRLSIAGAESTVAIGVARLGGRSKWVGVVGDDEVGALVRRTLAAEGVETDGIAVDPDRPTGLLLKERRTAAVTRVRYYRRDAAGAALAPEHVPAADVERARWLHLSGITPALSSSARDAVRHAAELASGHDTRLCVDLNYRSALWPADEAVPVLTELVKRADLVLATLDEAELLTGADEVDSAVRALAALGPRTVVVKRGAAGAVAWHEDALLEVPAVPTTLVDPVGAGDAFAAGLLADLAVGRPVAEALNTAAAVAAVDVSCPGDWEGLPTRAELEQLRGADVLR